MIRYHTTWVILCQIVMCLGLINTACTPSVEAPTDYSAYYFPIGSFPEGGMVYRYKNLRDPEAQSEVWRHIPRGKGLVESINYGNGEEIAQRQFDRIVNNGVMTDSLLLYSRDTTGRQKEINVKVISPHRFPFQPGDSTKVWLTHLDWYQPEDSLHIVLQRRRRFGGDTTWTSDGKTIPAVRFRTEDTFETEKDGWTSSSWSGEEIYAKGIGLVYYKRKISEEMVLEFQIEK